MKEIERENPSAREYLIAADGRRCLALMNFHFIQHLGCCKEVFIPLL